MQANIIKISKGFSSAINSSRVHVITYSLLLIATPFILLQNFLVEAISKFSGSVFKLGNINIPIVPLAIIILLVLILTIFRSHLTKLRILAGIIVLTMIALSQQITDYYFDHNFYDLQQNWHYIAYAIFAFMMYRDLLPRSIPLNKTMLITYFTALLLSTFDEAFQLHMSSRVFDISDIAKDLWGTLTGMVFLYLVLNKPSELRLDWKKVRHQKLKGYLKHPPSLLILMTVLAWLLLCFSSLLTDFIYWKLVVIFTVCGFLTVFFLFHISQYKWGKYSLVTALVLVILIQSFFFFKHHSDNIIHNQYGLTVYKGIPIIFFDVMIYADGSLRLVDKKHYFNLRDQKFFKKQKTDVIIIGSGYYGKGGNGFPLKTPVQFIYNPYLKRGTQVIILKMLEACKLFNRLRKERKNVLFILHNTC